LSEELGSLVEVYFYLGAALRSLYAALRSLNLADGLGDSPQLARGFAIVGTIVGFASMPRLAKRYGERALDVLSRADDLAANWWVPLVVGVSRLSTGDLSTAEAHMRACAAAADRVRDRRHWCDAIENLGIAAAMRGDWGEAHRAIEQYEAVSRADEDRRYIAAALRERAYVLVQTGDAGEAARCLAELLQELDDGLAVERDAALQDYHALCAVLAHARAEAQATADHLDACLVAIEHSAAETSFPNMHLALVPALAVALAMGRTGSTDSAWHPSSLRWGQALGAAIARHAASHRVAGPAAQLARAALAQTRGRGRAARLAYGRAFEEAQALGLAPEAALAARALRLPSPAATRGLAPDLPQVAPS
ncbi:MAG: hypothetical protein ABIY37_01720, partial [Devosia sp.]